jgi:glutathione S-transferase
VGIEVTGLCWALEEAGLAYELTPVAMKDLPSADYRRRQPFGQVPLFRDDTVELFESGAIVLHIASRSAALAPSDEAGRARMTAWVFAAMNSIEPNVMNLVQLEDDAPWAAHRRPQLEAKLMQRLDGLSTWLGERDYLEDRFTAGDLMMTAVLRELVDSGLLARFANLDAHRRRCEARPAFGRALEAQMRIFREHAPA